MPNWKLIAGSAGFACILSLLVGVLSGVAAGIAFLRAIIGGLAFGGLIWGITFIISKYLPDLSAVLVLNKDASQNKKGGVDIVIEDESPFDQTTPASACE